MEKSQSNKIVVCFFMLVIVAMVVLPHTSFAAEDLASRFAGVGTQVSAAGKFIKIIAQIIGVGLSLGALVLFAGMKKPGNQTSPIVPLIMMCVGVLLVSFGTFIDIGSQTVLGGTGVTEAGSILD